MNARTRLTVILATAALLMAAALPATAGADRADSAYLEAIERTTAMVWDQDVIDLAARYGLDVVNVTWEDTGRFFDSAVGGNISDLTIQVPYTDPETGEEYLALMPVIRFPNFTDRTADLSPDDFYLLVGNERGDDLERITLTDLLADPGRHLSDPGSWQGGPESLLAVRDSHVLVSAQAAFLPIPPGGEALFNPVIFNYQSYEGDPAVLTIVATREGTSMTVIDNTRDGFAAGWSWGQRLFFNQDGERASLTATRLSDFTAAEGSSGAGGPGAAGETGLDMVLVIQVPLKQKNPWYPVALSPDEEYAEVAAAPGTGDVEAAVIGHGAVEGPFTEIDDLDIERDPEYPIRVTVQFYRATSDGVVTEADLAAVSDQIERVYADADYVGSLVVDADPDRPTNHDGPQFEPADWWGTFREHLRDRIGIERLEQLIDRIGAFRAW